MGEPDFSAFFRAVNGFEPFPWQVRLASSVIETGRWPDILDLPTAAGKTSVIDIALYALACRPAVSPRRIVLVVDRRVVVDQGRDHADAILGALGSASDPAAAWVADRLRALSGAGLDEPPLVTQTLRGGMVREEDWARRPDQPVVAVSTVDQVGSRLLFSGYGVSDRMASVHAGLLGNDTLILLDEVHLSLPFAEVLRAIHRRWRRPAAGLPDRFGVVQMSATPGPLVDGSVVFRLDESDEANERLSRRMHARKLTRLDTVAVSGEEASRKEKLATTAVNAALSFVKDGARLVAIVLNRVDTARAARALLEGKANVESCLLTGRMRPIDRDREVSRVASRLQDRSARDADARPLIVVATQCIEAGADYDFDALVTECASLDALRQRFGRLDRRGDLGESHAVVLIRKDQLGKNADDPIYGTAMSGTFEWLSAKEGPLDFGVRGLELPEKGEIEQLLSPVTHAPILLPAHLDALARTGPRAWPLPEVALWLHGPVRRAPEVQVVWRADLDFGLIPSSPEPVIRLLAACPPGSLEVMALPISAVRRWLAGQVGEVADVSLREEEEEATGKDPAIPVVRWRGDESEILLDPRAIKPGDTIVVSASVGGVRHGNFDPEAKEPVTDLGDIVQWVQRGKATLRLHPGVLDADGLPADSVGDAPRPPGADDADRDPVGEVAEWLARAREGAAGTLAEIIESLGTRPRRIRLPGGTWCLVGPRGRGEVSSEDDGASFTEREVPLAQHLRHVKAVARRFADSIGLPERLAKDVALAAGLHDIGKVDPRFQRMLVGGSEVRHAMLTAPIAKSAVPLREAGVRQEARRRAGYPVGYRHELLSLALAASSPEVLEGASDPDLVLHLVSSHHGWCRPFPPALDDPEEIEVNWETDGVRLAASTRHRLARIDSGVADRYFRLVDRYGWWGLAWLEAVVRLADHRASEAERQGGEVTA